MRFPDRIVDARGRCSLDGARENGLRLFEDGPGVGDCALGAR